MRNTLVAPMLPLPTVRISTPRAFATRKPVGIEPKQIGDQQRQDVTNNWHNRHSMKPEVQSSKSKATIAVILTILLACVAARV